jgi:hypothetical protein
MTQYKLTLIGSSENATRGVGWPYRLIERAIADNGPNRLSWALVNVRACARMYRKSMHVHKAPKIGTPSIFAMCLFTYRNHDISQ